MKFFFSFIIVLAMLFLEACVAIEDEENPCFEKQTKFIGNMVANKLKSSSPENCQSLCVENEECEAWTFFTRGNKKNKCSLFSEVSEKLENKRNCISGPRICNVDPIITNETEPVSGNSNDTIPLSPLQRLAPPVDWKSEANSAFQRGSSASDIRKIVVRYTGDDVFVWIGTTWYDSWHYPNQVETYQSSKSSWSWSCFCYQRTNMIIFRIFSPRLPSKCNQSQVNKLLNNCSSNMACILKYDSSYGLRYSFVITWGSGSWSYSDWLVQSCKGSTRNALFYQSSSGSRIGGTPNDGTHEEGEEHGNGDMNEEEN